MLICGFPPYLILEVSFHCMPSLQMRRAASTPALSHSSKKFTEKEQIFTEYGQRLKVDKVIIGHHPTSQLTTVAPKKEVKVGCEEVMGGDMGVMVRCVGGKG